MIRVLLADDHPVVRSGYLRCLELADDIRVIAEAGDTDGAYAAFVTHAPDVVVTDLSMPTGGIELLRRLLLRSPQAQVLVFSMHDSAVLVRRALQSGPRGYVTKASPPECLIEAVRAIRNGRLFLSPDLPPSLIQRDPGGEADRLSSLSAREFEVFRLLAQGHSSGECADALKLSPKTIANQQTVIKEKLGVETLAALVHFAIRHRVITMSVV